MVANCKCKMGNLIFEPAHKDKTYRRRYCKAKRFYEANAFAYDSFIMDSYHLKLLFKIIERQFND